MRRVRRLQVLTILLALTALPHLAAAQGQGRPKNPQASSGGGSGVGTTSTSQFRQFGVWLDDATTREIPSPEGDPNPVRLGYSDDVGKTFTSIEGTEVSYHLTGKELYVRAVITSNLPHPNPSYEGQTQMAWTQPVGWKLAAGQK